MKKTDLNAVKDVALALLHNDIEPTPLSPFIVKHPYTDSGFVGLPREDAFICVKNIVEGPDAYRKWIIFVEEKIKSADSIYKISVLITKSYLFAFIKLTSPFLSRDDLSDLLGESWTKVEQSNMDANLSKTQLVSLFKKCNPKILMTKSEFAAFESLGDELIIYRGLTKYNAKNIKALSWTTDIRKAQWFASRFGGQGTIYQAKIAKEYVYAYFDDQNEKEVVVDPKKLQLIKKL